MRHLLIGLVACAAGWSQPYLISTIAGGVPQATPIAGTRASISPRGLAVDRTGSLYFSSRNTVYKLDAGGTLTRIAGNSRPGFAGDGGPAIDAGLNTPKGLAVDAAGNLYIADSGNGRVRRVSPQGRIDTFAGIGPDSRYVLTSDWMQDSDALKAQLFAPRGLAFDAAGNLYISDNVSIRKVSPDRICRLLAGSLDIQLNSTDYSAGNLAVDGNGTVMVIDPSYGLRAVAADGSLRIVSKIRNASGIAVDAAGNVYLARLTQLVRIGRDGVETVMAGSGLALDSAGDGGPAVSANLNGILDVAIDGSGNLYVSELWGFRLRSISLNGTITTVAGNGTEAWSGDGGPASAAQFDQPWGVLADAKGNLYVSDSGNHTIRKISADGLITTVAGDGVSGDSGDGGSGRSARLNQPLGMALDAAGNLYIADSGNHRIRRLSENGVITTVARDLSRPHGVAIDASGNLFIADTGYDRIRRRSPDGTVVTVAGDAGRGFSGDNGPAAEAKLFAPTSLTFDPAGNLLIADTGNWRIRKITPSGIISTVAGSDLNNLVNDDAVPATAVFLAAPQGIAADAAGNLFIGETERNHVRRVSASGVISTVAGRGLYGVMPYFDDLLNLNSHGYSGDDGPAGDARLDGPYGVAVDSRSMVYFADLANSAVRILRPVPIANAASNQMGPVAPGGIVSIYGTGLGPEQLTSTPPAGTEVLFNGIAAAVFYSSAAQVGAIVPDNLSGESAKVEIRYLGKSVASFSADLAVSAPALFTADSSGKGFVAALNQDGSYNSYTKPEAPGRTVTLFVTGQGAGTVPAITARIGAELAEVVRAAPSITQPGVLEVQVRIPTILMEHPYFSLGQSPNIPLPVVLRFGAAETQPSVFLTVFLSSGGLA